jgi:predicted phosphodiesterase
MTDCLLSCFQLIMVDFIGSDCPLLNPGSLETPFRPKMTDCHHSCLQSIEVNFIVGDCPLLNPGSLETPFRP